MPALARKLRLHDYFALAFGTMIGTGWLVLMDDWLGRGGPAGAALGFAIGGVILLPVGYVYGQWVKRLPDAAGEAAYTAQVFPPMVSSFTGWMMLLAYFIVCPWEAVALGKIAAYVFPALDTFELYRVAGQPVFLPRLILGIALTLLLATINYRGIRLSANFQKAMSSMVLLIFVALVGLSAFRGAPANFHPAFRATPFLSILLTLQIVPYFMTGFESVPKYAEEANPDFRQTSYMQAIGLALGVGAFFYAFCIVAVAYIAPWQSLLGKRFATAIAFEHGLGKHWPVQLILIMALFGLFQCFNGNFAASTRLLFAYARRGTVAPRFATIHAKFSTPSVSVIGITLGTLIGLLLGDAILVPVTEVGSMASALGWLAACLSFWQVESRPPSDPPEPAAPAGRHIPHVATRAITAAGIAVSSLLLLMKLIPAFPGHFTQAEWIALAIWLLLGAILHRRPTPAAPQRAN
ncbi:MAG TPA: APC family permease [Candidatus Binatus sp.]|jgi:APA family basic amino acid/polyamine antiporter|nr:APC family permease [Candidatus Binatus sp.]